MNDTKKPCNHHWVWRMGTLKNHCVDCDEYCKPEDSPEDEETMAWMAMDWLLTRIGSWTNARWDQHLRDRYGDEKADMIIGRLGYDKRPAGQPPRPSTTASTKNKAEGSGFVRVEGGAIENDPHAVNLPFIVAPLSKKPEPDPKSCIFCSEVGHTMLGSMCASVDQCRARQDAKVKAAEEASSVPVQQTELTRARIAIRSAFDAQTTESMLAALAMANDILNPWVRGGAVSSWGENQVPMGTPRAIVGPMEQMKTLVMRDKTYNVIESFGPNRVLINFDGASAFVDWNEAAGPFGIWELSGVPARDGAEKEAVARWTAAMSVTSVTVTAPE